MSTGWIYDVTASYEIMFYVQAGICLACSLQVMLFPVLKRLEPGLDTRPPVVVETEDENRETQEKVRGLDERTDNAISRTDKPACWY